MHNDEQFIRENASVLLSHAKVVAKTQPLGGQWKLDQITSMFSRKRHIEFHFLLANESGESLLGSAKIDRESSRVSQVEYQD